MKKFLLTLAAAVAYQFGNAQYYAIQTVGVADTYDWAYALGTGNATIIMNKPNDNVLTSAQTIPFPFTLYGTNYTSYKASDNGYITFDAAATTSDNSPATLPSATKPNNSIFGFWGDLELKAAPNANFPVEILNYTYGTAPNRVHVIEWYGVSKKGASIAANADVLVFAIRLYEDNHFDVVYSWGGSSSFTGTIGTQNAGTLATTIAGSPTLSYPVISGGSQKNSDAIIYTFRSGIQPTLDASVLSSSIPSTVLKTNPISVSGKIANYGSAVITSATFNYKLDGGATVSDARTGLNITPSGGTYFFTHATSITGLTPGLHSLKVWATNLNGGADANNANDSLTVSFVANNGIAANKYVLLEEATGGWCGYCPDGHLIMRDLLAANSKLIGVTHHNADGMINTESDLVNSTYAAGYPSGYINRVPVGGAVGLNRSTWSSNVATALSTVSPVNVTITNKSYNPTTKQITFTVNANFVDYAAGDMRIGAMVIEDNVRGNDVHNTWTQHNYYSSAYQGGAGGSGHELYAEPEWLVGYLHRHVVRNIPSGAFGTAGVIPSSVAPAGTYSKTYTWTVPNPTKVTYTTTTPTTTALWSNVNGWGMNKLNDMALVGFVANYNTDVTKREILNSTEVSLWSTGMDTKVIDMNTISADVYPNPSNGETKVQFTLTQNSDVTVKIVNALGQEVNSFNENGLEAGNHEVNFNVSELPTGVYFAIVSGNNFTQASAKFVVTK